MTTGPVPARTRSGRRAGVSGNRDAILAAARSQFAERGYDRVTMRSVAAIAGVDPALVVYYYGSKQKLFRESIELTLDPAEAIPPLLEPGLDGLGERLVRFYLDLWNDPDTAEAIRGTMRTAFSHEEAADLLRDFLSREIFARIAPALPGPDPRLRVELAGAHLVGLAISRFIVKVEPLASVDEETIVARVAPAIQGYLTGAVAEAKAPRATPPARPRAAAR